MAFFMNGFPFGFEESGMGDDDDFGGFGGFGGGFSRKKEADTPVDTKKLYHDLEIEKTATAEEIRKAYKKMAYKHHPDRGGDQTKFQEVQHAYEVLSDESKRKVYDVYGEEGLKEGRGKQFEGSIFDLLHGKNKGSTKKKSKSVLHTLEVSLEEIYIGKTIDYDISRYRTCLICKGSGSKDTKANTRCMDCHGKGIKIVARNIGYGYIQQSVECSNCKGEGRVIKDADKCEECKGERATKVKKTLNVYVEKGSPSGKKHIFSGESDEVPGLEPGDAIVEISIKNHKRFQRKGADLIYTADISLLEALTGFNLIIQHLDGRHISVKNVPGEIIKPGVIKTVKECGLPFFESPFKYGNLYINFNVDFPDKLEKSQAELLLNLFPNLIQPEIKDQIDESYTMIDFNQEHENTHHAGGNKDNRGYEEEDQEEGQHFGGGRQMRCGHQ